MDETLIGLLDLIDPTETLAVNSESLGSPAGFDTIEAVSDPDFGGHVRSKVVSALPPSPTSLGFWSEHAFADLAVGDGPLTVSIGLQALSSTAPFDGGLQFALAYAMGNLTGSNPRGTAGAGQEVLVEAALP